MQCRSKSITAAVMWLAVAAAIAVSVANAQQAAGMCPMPSSVVYPATTTCNTYNTCSDLFCGCIGQPNNTNAQVCYQAVSPAVNCSTRTTCLVNYMACLERVAEDRMSSDLPCALRGLAIHTTVLRAVATSYQGSLLQENCIYRVCDITNGSTTCNFGVNASAVCTTPAFGTTMPPSPTPSSFVPAILARVTVGGSHFGKLVAAENRSRTERNFRNDAADRIDVSSSNLFTYNLYEGSLVVIFGVSTAAGLQPDVLQTRILGMANDASWLNRINAQYAEVTDEPIDSVSVFILSTAPPGLVTGTPTPGDGNIDGAATFALATLSVVTMVVMALFAF